MSSEVITKNDLKNVLDAVLPPGNDLIGKKTFSGTTDAWGAINVASGTERIIPIGAYFGNNSYIYRVLYAAGSYYLVLSSWAATDTRLANTAVSGTVYYIHA